MYGVDLEPLAIKMCRMQFRELPAENFQVTDIESIPFEDQFFDAVICSAVLHFARSREHFQRMWKELTRITITGGILFVRMASRWGLSEPASQGFTLYADDELLHDVMLKDWTLLEPVKSVWVEGKRSMSVLVFERR